MSRFITAVLAAAVAAPFAAMAQSQDVDVNVYEDPYATSRMETARAPSIGIMGNVGANDYNRDLNNEINAGVGYGAAVDLSPTRNIGLELGYNGAVNDLDDTLSTDGRLITNQLGGNLRVNLVPPTRDLPANMRPFVFGGAFYHRIDTDNFTPGIEDDINAFALPVGLGLEAEVGKRVLVGGRFTYNFLFNEVDALGGEADTWAAVVNVGTRLGL